MFPAASVCLFVNTITSERVNIWWWNLVGALNKNLGRVWIWRSAPLGCTPQKCGIGLRRWENQRTLSSWKFKFITLCVRCDPSCHWQTADHPYLQETLLHTCHLSSLLCAYVIAYSPRIEGLELLAWFIGLMWPNVAMPFRSLKVQGIGSYRAQTHTAPYTVVMWEREHCCMFLMKHNYHI